MQTILADNTDYADYTENINNIVFQSIGILGNFIINFILYIRSNVAKIILMIK